MNQSSANFLPLYSARVSRDADGRRVKCLFRDKNIGAAPEELIRQRVLHFLFSELLIPRLRLSLEDRLVFADGSVGRPDIVVWGDDAHKEASLLVECKANGVLLGEDVARQAIAYARKLRARQIWLTNGDSHRFLSKDHQKQWIERTSLDSLGGRARASQPALPSVPPRALSEPDLRRYLTSYEDLADLKMGQLANFVLSIHRLMFAPSAFFELPWSHRGLHIIEDRGLSQISINTPGGAWGTVYRMFLVATEGRVETAGLGMNRYPNDEAGLILCVPFIKQNRKHHALQLLVRRYVEQSEVGFDVWHDGRMGGRALKSEQVREAFNEAGRDDLFLDQHRIGLGHVPAVDRITWRTSRDFLANLFHYALVRSQLREAFHYTHG